MLKELWHWTWMFLSHLLTFRWSNLGYHYTNLKMYLKYGFTLYDLQDADEYLLNRISSVLEQFSKHTVAYPEGTTLSKWKYKILQLSKTAKFITTEEFFEMGTKRQSRCKSHFLMELRRHFFWLWF